MVIFWVNATGLIWTYFSLGCVPWALSIDDPLEPIEQEWGFKKVVSSTEYC